MEKRFLLIDRRSNRLCEILHFTHGETADLFWIDITDRPEVTLDWTWRDDGTHTGVLSPPEPKPEAATPTTIDYGVQTFQFDAGKGTGWHQHPIRHDCVVKKGRVLIACEGSAPQQLGVGERTELQADIRHSITALEDGTEIVNAQLG